MISFVFKHICQSRSWDEIYSKIAGSEEFEVAVQIHYYVKGNLQKPVFKSNIPIKARSKEVVTYLLVSITGSEGIP